MLPETEQWYPDPSTAEDMGVPAAQRFRTRCHFLFHLRS